MINLIQSLIKAQGDFPPVTKDAKNPHFKNNYASLEQVISLTGKALRDNGLCIVQTFEGVDKPCLRTTLYHVSGESVSGVQVLLMGKPDAQGLAGASTYARRYGILSILGISSEDDDGNTASEKPKTLSDSEQIATIELIENAKTEDELKKIYMEAMSKCKAINDKVSETMFVKAKDKRKAELVTK